MLLMRIESDEEMAAFEDKCFRAWLELVVSKIRHISGNDQMDADDFKTSRGYGHFDFRACYEEGEHPTQAAKKALHWMHEEGVLYAVTFNET